MTTLANSGGEPPRLPPARPRVRKVPAPLPVPVDPEAPPPAAATYEVGYKKPPVHTRFPPGKSGNPKGRPRGAKGLNTMVRETMTAKVTVRTAEGTRKVSRMEALLQKTLELALKGNPRAVDILIKLYATAVPDRADSSEAAGAEDFTATDLAMLETLRQSLVEHTQPPAGDAVISNPGDRSASGDLPAETAARGTDLSPPPRDDQWTSDWDREV